MSHQIWSVLIKNTLSPNQIYLLSCHKDKIKPAGIINYEAELHVCQAKGLIDEDGNLTNRGTEILNDFEIFLTKTKRKVTTAVLGEDFMTKVNEYREMFPKKKLPSGQLARQSTSELKEKFIWFFKTYPQYNWDLVLDITERFIYISSLKNYLYMPTSSYFIKKTHLITKETTSKLADYCQMAIEDPSFLENFTLI